MRADLRENNRTMATKARDKTAGADMVVGFRELEIFYRIIIVGE